VQKTTKDLYKLLGLSKEASQDDIRKAHRKLVRKYHPDANPEDPQAEQRFKEIQQAYEVLSNSQKRQEYDKELYTSSRASAGRPRRRQARAGGRTGGDTSYTVDLSDLLGKLQNLSSERSDGRKGGSFKLRGEEVAHLAKVLGEEISRISELLGKDTTYLSKRLGEKIRVNAKASFGDAQYGEFSTTDEDMPGGEPSEVSNRAREKRVKGPRAPGREKRVKGPGAPGREKRVKGPSARRKRDSD
jgi:DnaJ-class molecular chaperone